MDFCQRHTVLIIEYGVCSITDKTVAFNRALVKIIAVCLSEMKFMLS